MADIYSKKKRSDIMSRIRRDDTKSEIIIRKFLFGRGFRYRKNDSRYPGSPDIVLPKYNSIVFIHGCFWHSHENCKDATLPKTRREFWENKISENRERDRRDVEALKTQGWKVIVIWQCKIKTKSNRQKRLELLIDEIKSK